MKKIVVLLLCLTMGADFLFSQDIERNVKKRLTEYFDKYSATESKISKQPKLKRFKIDYKKRKIDIHASESFAYQPFRRENVDSIYQHVKLLLPGPVNYYRLTIYVNDKPIEELIPNIYREKKREDRQRLSLHADYEGAPWVKNLSRPYEATRGLQGRHIALWQSHGRYFRNDKNEWMWQRPRLFCTAEDLFTQSFVLPYVIPMLENAGAVVYTPRERDMQRNEVIVDNDTPFFSRYIESNSKKGKWATAAGPGFAQKKAVYEDGENPFFDGSTRFIRTERPKSKDHAFVEWSPNLPEAGKYAVYVSYRTLPGSVSDARYLVFHNGGVTEFKVNQQIGGGTWVYLGTFEFDRGSSDRCMVVLSNESNEEGVVSADAVRFGGGMGNIARNGLTSGLPRYLEGARYFTQWAGMPYDAYASRKGENDYPDDINARSNTINFLSGGSVYNPTQAGMGVPFDLSVAIHSDAGVNVGDTLIGSLGIHTSDFNEGKLGNGTDRYASRDLVDILLTQIGKDITANTGMAWMRRDIWDKNYSETRIPAMPSAIVEMFSHQNFADMQLGHDPHFKFIISRAIYKGILRFMATQHGTEYIVQPLPVSHFAIRFGQKENTLDLSWQGEYDPQEPTAQPQEYIVYTRIGNGGFDNGVLVSKPMHTVKIEPGLIYSFKVAAVNRGGESFPSEILSACKSPDELARVLIVNGFDRLSAPAIINTCDSAGFDLARDPGVFYLSNPSFCGAQIGFDRSRMGEEGDGCLGDSGTELEGMNIAGNTFDYPFVHGKAIQAAERYSFVSCSDEAVEDGMVTMEDYSVVDYILGLEKENPTGGAYYKTFSPSMQSLLTSYFRRGGNLFVSGAYVGSDMSRTQSDREFTEHILKYSYEGSLPPVEGSLADHATTSINGLERTFTIPRRPNERTYSVATPDCIVPVSPAFSAFAYLPDNQSAGIAYKGTDYRTFVLGFPFESIESEQDRAVLMKAALGFFLQ